MLDKLLEVLGNSHFEAYLVGPLLGVLFGVIFNALGKRPGPDNADSTPRDVKREIDEYRQRSSEKQSVHHHHHYHGARSSSNDDGGAVIFLAGFAMVVVLFLFAAFLPQIAGTLYFFNTTVAMCCITAALLACLTGRFNTSDWWLQAVFPAIVSTGCFWLTIKARAAISPDVIVYAQSLLADKPLNVGTVLNAAVKFFTSLRNDYVQWMLFDMLAFVCVITCAIFAFLRFVFYVSLSNAREGNRGVWVWLALRTEKFGGIGSAFFVAFLFIFGVFLAHGDVYQLLHQTA
ncbi:hypothetical protein [Burkholderia pseudomallei]|uniref:hypothetical protein n=1 Tax=Burkholderia pseudomallei TaxID=28450 RepID=UPI0021C32FAF|nr:hypothetical protein [Burkholderia pseudomallei]